MSDWDGKTVTIKTGTFAGKQFVVEKRAWDFPGRFNSPAVDVLGYDVVKRAFERAQFDEGLAGIAIGAFYYGKIDGLGQLVHESEFA